MENFKSRENLIALVVIVTVILIAAIFTLSVLYNAAQEKAANNAANQSLSVDEGVAAYTNLAGEQLNLSDNVGKILVINSWASWSPDSNNELPNLAKLANEYQDKGVVVLAINRAESKTTAERFLRTVGTADSVQLVLDPDDHYYHSISGYAMPETVFYDTNGNIVHHQHGVLTLEEMIIHTEKALSKSD